MAKHTQWCPHTAMVARGQVWMICVGIVSISPSFQTHLLFCTLSLQLGWCYPRTKREGLIYILNTCMQCSPQALSAEWLHQMIDVVTTSLPKPRPPTLSSYILKEKPNMACTCTCTWDHRDAYVIQKDTPIIHLEAVLHTQAILLYTVPGTSCC